MRAPPKPPASTATLVGPVTLQVSPPPRADYDTEGECNWDVGAPSDLGIPGAFVNLRVDFGNALDDARTLFPNGEDVAVGDDGYWMPEVNVLTFSTPSGVFSVQIVVVDSGAIDARELAIALATTAAPRL